MEPTERREDVEVLAHVHLRKEHINLEHALQAISDWVRSGAGEGANFLVTRLTGPITGGSLFGGADISQFTRPVPGGHCAARAGSPIDLDFSSGSHVSFPLEAHVDLNSGEVALTWMPPAQAAHSSAFRLAYVQKLASHGPTYFFDTEQTTDEAVYSLTVVLL